MSIPVDHDEAARIDALHRLDILDTPREPSFDRICAIACEALEVPIALVSLVDCDRQWFKAEQGLGVRETERAAAFCNYTVLHDEVFVVPDAARDPRFSRNRLVTGEPGIRFYAGAPLLVGPSLRLGSLCVIDRRPRDLAPDRLRMLAALRDLVVGEIWLHRLARVGFVAEPFAKSGGSAMPFDVRPSVTGAQLRAARGLLGWSAARLAAASGVSESTIKRAEASDGPPPLRRDGLDALETALRHGGVDFTFGPGAKPGVRPA